MEFFEGKKAVVTGAAQGIGHGIATALYKHKAKVVAVDIKEDGLQALKQEYPDMETIVCDLTDWDKTRSTFEGISDIDMLVNNAGVVRIIPFLEISKEDIYSLVNVNMLSTINIMQVVGQGMKERGKGGSIVNLSSVLSSKMTMDGQVVYSGTKAAIERMTTAAAHELGKYQIRINSVHPGCTKTPLVVGHMDKIEPQRERTSLGRFNEIEDVVGPVLFLLNDKMSGMVQGEKIFVDGGYN